MTLEILRDDALTTTESGFGLRLSLPWIRSLPLSGLTDLEISIDGAPMRSVRLAIGDTLVAPEAVADESAWWFIQDRLAVTGGLGGASGGVPDRALLGRHDVSVSFSLVIPYLQVGPDGPLRLSFEAGRPLVVDAPASAPTVSRDVA